MPMPYYYCYILKSLRGGSYYKGFTEDPIKRLAQHNNAGSSYTSTKMPWELVYVEAFTEKRDALIREKNLKKADRARIEAVLLTGKNIVKNFLDNKVG